MTKPINFEVNLTKMKWCPKKVSEIPEVISRAFEREISMQQVQPLIGTDHIKEWILREDKDIPEFYNAPNMMQEWIAEKLIRMKIPPGIMPPDFTPKKVKVLARGEKIAKFFGEDECSTRKVECSLKLFDCNHFYMKQTLPGSGASPHWTIFEGRWTGTERGVRLEYLLRYSWMAPSSKKPAMDFAIDAVRSDLVHNLAWDGETERQLNGNLPAVVGTEAVYWAELVREGDTKGEAKIRWNLETDGEPEEAAAASGDGGDGSGLAGGSPARVPELRPEFREPFAAQSGAKSASGPGAASAAAAPPARPKPPQPPRPSESPPVVLDEKDVESPWPLYVGTAVFALLAAMFMYSNIGE